MITTVRFYTKNVQNNSFFGSSIVYVAVPANKLRLKISDAYETLLSGDQIEWDDKWQLFDNVNTNTTTVTKEKNILMAKMKAACRLVFGSIPDALLTTADREALRLFVRKAGSLIVVANLSATEAGSFAVFVK